MKLAKIALRRLLDRPTDPEARDLAAGVLELLESHLDLEVRPPSDSYLKPTAPTAGAEAPPPPASAPTAVTLQRPGFARGSVGYGYRRGSDPNVFIIDPDAMRVLRTIKDLRMGGMTYREIADTLNRAEAPSYSGRPWNHPMVKIQWTRIHNDPDLSAQVANFDPLPGV